MTTSPITAQIQGVTGDLSRANGSYDAVDLGGLTPDRLAEVLAAMTRLSPPEGEGDLCWPNLLVSGPTGDVAFSLGDEHGRLVTEGGADVTDLGEAVASVTGVPFTGVIPAYRRGVAPRAEVKAHPHRKVPKPAQPGRVERPEQRSPQARFDPRPRERGLGPKAKDLVGLVKHPVRLKEYRDRFPYLMAGPGDPEFRRVTDELDGSDLLPEQKLMIQNLEPRAWAILHPGMRRRILAFLLDLPLFIVFFALGLAAIASTANGSGDASQGTAALAWIVPSYWLYFAASELVFGASPGGLLTGLRVVDERGRPPSLGLCLRRPFTRIFRILGAVRIATRGGSEVVLG